MKVLITEKISKDAVEILKKEHEVEQKELTPEKLLEEIESYDAILVRSKTKITKEVIERANNLKVIGRAGVGVDNIDIKTATERKIPVVYAPTGATISVAELTIGLMLSIARHLPKADKTTKEGKWLKAELEGEELYGKTIGFIGLGRIGYEVAKRVKAFGMNIIVYDPYIIEEKAREVDAKITNLEELLKNSDFITIHVPLTKETEKMISEKEFAIMKNNAYIINCARGGVIDENALYNALLNKKIRGACLDVFEKEPPTNSQLLKLENIVFTPHIGASTHEGQLRAGKITVEQMLKVLRGEKADLVANPEVYK